MLIANREAATGTFRYYAKKKKTEQSKIEKEDLFKIAYRAEKNQVNGDCSKDQTTKVMAKGGHLQWRSSSYC